MNYESCYDCTKRIVGCHSTCPDYIHDKENDPRRSAGIERHKEDATRSYQIASVYRVKKSISHSRTKYI